MSNLKEIEGKVIKDIIKSETSNSRDVFVDELIFICTDGSQFKMSHLQSCCEGVWLEDIVGELDDLIGQEITLFEKRTDSYSYEMSEEVPQKSKVIQNKYSFSDAEMQEYTQWTFYEIQCPRGSVTLRWYGNSNGHYSVEVDFEKIKEADYE